MQLTLAPVVTVMPGRRTGAGAAVVSLVLVAVYGLYRVVAPPGGAEPETLDAVGVTVVAIELAVVVAGAMLVRNAASFGRPEPGGLTPGAIEGAGA